MCGLCPQEEKGNCRVKITTYVSVTPPSVGCSEGGKIPFELVHCVVLLLAHKVTCLQYLAVYMLPVFFPSNIHTSRLFCIRLLPVKC